MMSLLLILSPFLPLAMAMAMVPAGWRLTILRLTPLAPLPALIVALGGEPGLQVLMPEVLLGLVLGLDDTRRLVLLFTAILWLLAAIYGFAYIPADAPRHRYCAFFLASMGGNLGLIIALDVPGFYVFFSLMTLSSYILVVFDGTEKAYRAGRAYLVLSIIGETLLLLGFLRAVSAAGSLLIADIPGALPQAEGRTLTWLLLFAGFSIKAGQLPLHVWLPLAHPAAPTPASAVLSGAMIKAGLLGMMLFLPFGEAALPRAGYLISLIGLATAFYGVAAGLSQSNPKTVLAYSSLSQMGVMVAALGVALVEPAAATVILPTVTLYAVHHGVTKAGLFFAVGVVQKATQGAALALAAAAAGALAIAGFPASAGALAKLLLKEALEATNGEAARLVLALLPLSALATALLMFRYIHVLRHEAGTATGASGRSTLAARLCLWLPFLIAIALGQLLPWAVLHDGPTLHAALVFGHYGLWESFWPLSLALAAALVVAWLLRRRPDWHIPRVPEGDWIALLPSMRVSAALWKIGYRRVSRNLALPPELPIKLSARIAARIENLDNRWLHSNRGSAAAVLVVIAVVLALIH